MFPCASESTEMTAPQVMPAGSCGHPSATWYGFSCAYTAPAETSAARRITTRMDFIDAFFLFIDGICFAERAGIIPRSFCTAEQCKEISQGTRQSLTINALEKESDQ